MLIYSKLFSQFQIFPSPPCIHRYGTLMAPWGLLGWALGSGDINGDGASDIINFSKAHKYISQHGARALFGKSQVVQAKEGFKSNANWDFLKEELVSKSKQGVYICNSTISNPLHSLL